MVTTFYPPYSFGGDGSYIKALSEGLVARGHQVDVIHCVDAFMALSQGPSPPTPGDDGGVRVHRIHSRAGLLSVLYTQQTGRMGFKSATIRQLLNRDYDVVHFHNISLFGGPQILHCSHAPVTLYTLHEHWLLCPTHVLWKNNRQPCDAPSCFSCMLRSQRPPQLWRYTPALRKALARVDRFLAPSAFTAARHQSLGIADRIELLPLFSAIEPPQPPPPLPARAQFLFVGRVTKSKGIAWLIEQMASRDDVDFIVAGSGDLLAPLRKQYRHHTHIHLPGRIGRSGLASLYASSQALIFPSLAPETFGLVIVEAFACGTPVISSGAGAGAELVKDSGAGMVYHDQRELHQAIDRLKHPQTRKRLADRARQRYLQRYTKARHLDDYVEIVDGLR